jgi:hypothetical protein
VLLKQTKKRKEKKRKEKKKREIIKKERRKPCTDMMRRKIRNG